MSHWTAFQNAYANHFMLVLILSECMMCMAMSKAIGLTSYKCMKLHVWFHIFNESHSTMYAQCVIKVWDLKKTRYEVHHVCGKRIENDWRYMHCIGVSVFHKISNYDSLFHLCCIKGTGLKMKSLVRRTMKFVYTMTCTHIRYLFGYR